MENKKIKKNIAPSRDTKTYKRGWSPQPFVYPSPEGEGMGERWSPFRQRGRGISKKRL